MLVSDLSMFGRREKLNHSVMEAGGSVAVALVVVASEALAAVVSVAVDLVTADLAALVAVDLEDLEAVEEATATDVKNCLLVPRAEFFSYF
jgi:hypothetical protein